VSCHVEKEQRILKSDLVNKLEVIFYDSSFAKIREKVFPAADYGGKADGKTVNTKAIQAAIDAAHQAGGGIVTLPQGITVSGALFLKSNVELRLNDGVVLQAVNDDARYPNRWTRIAGIEMEWPAALINIYEQKNVRVTGKGVIDGNGAYWWEKFWGKDRRGGMLKDYESRGLRWAVDYDAKRVRPIVVYKSKDVLLKGFTVKRSGFWTITFTYSDRVYAEDITIRNNIGGYGPSTDGFDIDSSCDILIENCDVDCNDDNFCIKAGRDSDGLRVDRPVENVVIRNCVTGKGHGLVTLGSETSGGMHNIEVYGLEARDTDHGFRLKSAKIRGGVIRNIWIHDVIMDRVSHPFHWELNWFPAYSYPPKPKTVPESEWPAHWHVMLTPVNPPERGIPEFHNLRISNVKVTNADEAIYANAYPEKPIRNVIFENVRIQAKSGGSLTHCRDWSMKNVVLKAGSQVQRNNCANVQLPVLK
jgi:polygalacturonase